MTPASFEGPGVPSRAKTDPPVKRAVAGTRVLTFTGVTPRDAAVQAWLDGEPRELRRIAQLWFQKMRECGGDVRELMHDGCPTACVGEAGFGYVNSFKDHVNVGFFRGSTLPDPEALLQGTGKLGRHVKLFPDTAFSHPAALEILITEAYRNIKACLGAGEPTKAGRSRI